MPEIILKYTLPEEEAEFKAAQSGTAALAVLSEFDRYLQNKLKYDNLSDKEYRIVEDIRNQFYTYLNERSLRIYE
jgi:hypothetical protein